MSDVFAAPHAPAEQTLILKVASVVRYRFFLYAGLLPYLLGAGWTATALFLVAAIAAACAALAGLGMAIAQKRPTSSDVVRPITVT